MTKTVRFDLTAAPAALTTAKGTRRMPQTPEKHWRAQQGQRLTSVEPRQSTRTSNDKKQKTRKPQAGQQTKKAADVSSKGDKSTRQPRDDKGRFIKTTRKPTKTEILLDKLKAKHEKTSRLIERLEVALDIEKENRTTQERKTQAKATRKLAKDYKWICLRVLDLHKKLENGTISQQKYAQSQLPKYTRRQRNAKAAFIQYKGHDTCKTAFKHQTENCKPNKAKRPPEHALGDKSPPEPGSMATQLQAATSVEVKSQGKLRLKGTSASPRLHSPDKHSKPKRHIAKRQQEAPD